MKRILAAVPLPGRAAALLFALTAMTFGGGRAIAGQDSTDRWFRSAAAWYDHPCSSANPVVFGLYGQVDTPENRRNYDIAKRDPSQCATLFPVTAVRPRM